jgi:hypothetical protein
MLNMKNKKQMRFVLIFMLPYFISVGGTVIIGFLIGGYSNVQYRYVVGITPLVGIMLSILGRAIADKYYPNKKVIRLFLFLRSLAWTTPTSGICTGSAAAITLGKSVGCRMKATTGAMLPTYGTPEILGRPGSMLRKAAFCC